MALLMEKVSYQRLSSLLVEVTDYSFFTDSVWRQFIAGQSKGLTGTRLYHVVYFETGYSHTMQPHVVPLSLVKLNNDNVVVCFIGHSRPFSKSSFVYRRERIS